MTFEENETQQPYERFEKRTQQLDHLERRREAVSRKRRLVVSSITTLFALLGAVLSISVLSQSSRARDRDYDQDFVNSEELISVVCDLEELQTSVLDLRASIGSIQPPVPESVLSARQEELNGKVELIDRRLKSMESALLENPEKALSIPLLRKDFGELSMRIKDSRSASRAEFDRLYSQQTWMLSGIGTVLLAVAGASITMFVKSLPKPSVAEQIGADQVVALVD